MSEIQFPRILSNPIKSAKIVGTNIGMAVYLRQTAKRGVKDYIMSRGSIVEFAKCPHRWVQGYDEETEGNEAVTWGDLIDCLALMPDSFATRFAVAPDTYPDTKTKEPKEWNWNANYCKAWREKQNGRKPIKSDLFAEAQTAVQKLTTDPLVNGLLIGSQTQVMVTGEYDDPDTGLTIPLRGLIDVVAKERSLADLKTGNSAHPAAWPKTVYERAYHVQAALYTDLWQAATGEVRNWFHHIIQENYPPYEIGHEFLSSDFIDMGRTYYVNALKKYCQCLAAGQWPGYEDGRNEVYEGWLCCQPQAWMVLER